MIRRLLMTAAVAALAVCDAAPTEPKSAPEAPPIPAVEPVADNVLTPQGLGALRIGMTRAEVEAAAGPDARPGAVGGADPEACDMFHPARTPDGVLVMIEKGVLTSIWLRRASPVTTADGTGIGADAAALKAKYGARAVFSGHKYEGAPSGYLTTWTGVERPTETYVEDANARGLVFEIGQDGKVKSIAGGGPSIQYVEGCS